MYMYYSDPFNVVPPVFPSHRPYMLDKRFGETSSYLLSQHRDFHVSYEQHEK
jgi:hypothetical protein